MEDSTRDGYSLDASCGEMCSVGDSISWKCSLGDSKGGRYF